MRNSTKMNNRKEENFDVIEYSSGDSDSEFMSPFNVLSTDEKTNRIYFLWGKAFRRAKGAMLFI